MLYQKNKHQVIFKISVWVNFCGRYIMDSCPYGGQMIMLRVLELSYKDMSHCS